MNRMAAFEKVSEEVFVMEMLNRFEHMEADEARDIYGRIRLPKRATSGSAGYDFLSTINFTLRPGEAVMIPTGIRCKMEEGWVLSIYPRSGLGFKYRLQLNNTVGIIDSDYYYASNEGHIMCPVFNDSHEDRTLMLNEGDAFVQGVFMPYGITYDDEVEAIRTGGFGSTGN